MAGISQCVGCGEFFYEDHTCTAEWVALPKHEHEALMRVLKAVHAVKDEWRYGLDAEQYPSIARLVEEYTEWASWYAYGEDEW